MPNPQPNYRLESDCRFPLYLERGGEEWRVEGLESIEVCTYFINGFEGVNFYLTLVFFSVLIFNFYAFIVYESST